jgi:uncharacterized damage-inducible protein DinB
MVSESCCNGGLNLAAVRLNSGKYDPMSNVPSWFERKFTFGFPATLYPNICMRLLGTPARAEELLSGVAHEIRTAKPDGKWSIQEHAGHLTDMEPLWAARVNDFVADNRTLTVADLGNRRTHEANHNGRPFKEILREFRTARFELVERLERLEASQFARTLIHPRLEQPMRLVDHLYFVTEHDDHHLAIMREMMFL